MTEKAANVREPWFATLRRWWNDDDVGLWGWRLRSLFSFAVGGVAIWGAAKFGGGWAWAYGSVAVINVALGAVFLKGAGP